MGAARARCGGCLRLNRSVDSPGRAGAFTVRERPSFEKAARSIEKIAPELLTITEPEVRFRNLGFRSVGEGFLRDDLDRGLSTGAADRANSDNCNSDDNRDSDDQLRDAACHDRLHP